MIEASWTGGFFI